MADLVRDGGLEVVALGARQEKVLVEGGHEDEDEDAKAVAPPSFKESFMLDMAIGLSLAEEPSRISESTKDIRSVTHTSPEVYPGCFSVRMKLIHFNIKSYGVRRSGCLTNSFYAIH